MSYGPLTEEQAEILRKRHQEQKEQRLMDITINFTKDDWDAEHITVPYNWTLARLQEFVHNNYDYVAYIAFK